MILAWSIAKIAIQIQIVVNATLIIYIHMKIILVIIFLILAPQNNILMKQISKFIIFQNY